MSTGTPAPAPASGAQTPAPAPSSQGGKTSEQLVAELSNKNAALAESREKERALKEELETLKAAGRVPAAAGSPVPQEHDNVRQLNELWEVDPRRAMQTELQMALRWYDQSNSQLDTQVRDVKKKYSDFGQYSDDVYGHLRSLPLEARTRPGVVEAAYYYIKGQQADTLVNLSREQLIAKIRAGESVQGLEAAMPGGVPQKKDPAAPTADQIAAARAMNMSIDKYMAGIKT